MKSKKPLILLVLILLFSAILRFYNLMHDSPYFFNPDERNMTIAITRFTLPAKLSEIPSCLLSEFFYHRLTANCSLNPHFFAYGQFPLYLAFVSDNLIRGALAVLQGLPLNNTLTTDFPSAIFWLRFYSALSSFGIVLLVFLISKQLFPFRFSLFASLMAAFTPGLIQSAHFGTTESFLTFFFLTTIYLSFKLLKTDYLLSLPKYLILNTKYIILLSLTIGLAIGSKFTGLFFLVAPLIVLIFQFIKLPRKNRKKRNEVSGSILKDVALAKVLIVSFMILSGSVLFSIISSPYNLIEPGNFQSAVFGYESDVAIGKYEAFYTRQFVNTIPIIFQAKKIFPYALGWPLFTLGSLGIFLAISRLIIKATQSIKLKFKILKLKN